jgi:hypothetical protein
MVAETLSLQALLKALVSRWQVRLLNVLAKQPNCSSSNIHILSAMSGGVCQQFR